MFRSRLFFRFLSLGKKLPFEVALIIIDFPLRILRKRIVLVREDRIGHQAGDLAVNLYQANTYRKYKKIKTYFVFYTPHHLVANTYLASLLKESVSSLGYRVLTTHNPFLLSTLFKIFSPKNFIHSHWYRNLFSFKLFSTDHGTRLPFALIPANNSVRNANHLPSPHQSLLGDYLVFCCRDAGFDNAAFPNLDTSYHDYRNSDIDDFEVGIKFLLKSSSFTSAFRIGSISTKKLSWSQFSNSKTIYDYSFSSTQSPHNDVEIIRNSQLFIGNGGLEHVAAISGVPIIKINKIPILEECGFPVILALSKLLYSKKYGRFLSLKEISDLNIGCSYYTSEYTSLGLEIVSNTKQDIKDALLDYLHFRQNGNSWSYNPDNIALINEFIRLVNRFDCPMSRGDKTNIFAPSFLRKHSFLLN